MDKQHMPESQQPHLLPLESYLNDKVLSDRNAFPQRDDNYFSQYINIKNWLTDRHYTDADAGLATDGNRYTHHNLGHVNDVIEVAGSMLQIKKNKELLSGFEAYVLLVAILLHDSGNAEGRKDHEKKTAQIIREMKDVAGTGTQEKKLISKIAQSHGGTALYKNISTKDTITTLINSIQTTFSNDVTIRPRLLAAILRLSDELAEKPSRANSITIKEAYDLERSTHLPDVIHNLYCNIIQISIIPESHEIKISFDVDKNLLQKTFTIEKKDTDGNKVIGDIYLIDYIAIRLQKSDRERRYCNRFMGGLLHFDSISSTIEITDDYETLETIDIKIEERGFPDSDSGTSIKSINSRLDGKTLFDSYNEVTEHCNQKEKL